MNILEALDQEIDRLQRARTLLANTEGKRRGRPVGSVKAKKQGGMTAEGRARVAKAMRERWAKKRAAASKKAA